MSNALEAPPELGLGGVFREWTIARVQSFNTRTRMESENPKSKIHPNQPAWSRIAAGSRFQHLLAVKKVFIVPAFMFFLVYYLLLPILVGYAPKLMSTKVFGSITLAYLYALSQFVVGGIIAVLYLKAASRFDDLIRDVIENETFAHADDGRRES